MPNWVYNTIVIEGKEADIKKFLDKAQRTTNGVHNFSFWNFVTPPLDHLDEYYETNGWTKDPNTGETIHTGNTEFNWYNWNINNWGTKWNACEVSVEFIEKNLLIQFSTAWGQPDPVFVAMTEQHPELSFDFEWEEEQGWGGKALGESGIYTNTESWDIPESHADYVALGRTDSCNCNHSEHEDYWYNDCPRVNQEEMA
jgi:hypothetical protein